MLNKLLEYIKNFYKEICNDLKQIDIVAIFTNPKLFIIFILLLLAIVIVFANLNIFFVLKGIISSLVQFFFTF